MEAWGQVVERFWEIGGVVKSRKLGGPARTSDKSCHSWSGAGGAEAAKPGEESHVCW